MSSQKSSSSLKEIYITTNNSLLAALILHRQDGQEWPGSSLEQLSKPVSHDSHLICVKWATSVETQVTATCIAIAPASQDSKHCSSSILTLSRRHLFSLMAPMQPTKPMIMTNVPVTISRLAADRDGKEEERVAKFPWVTASQMPTPRIPQPPNWENKEKQKLSYCIQATPDINPCQYGSGANQQSHLIRNGLSLLHFQ